MKREYSKALIYFCFFCIILLIHIPMQFISDDEMVVATITNESLLGNFLNRWYGNGRIITDVLANAFYRIPFIIWKVVDSVVYVMIARILVYLFSKNTVHNTLITCSLILLFPFNYLSSAGYIATTTNYVYPVLCLLLVAIPFKKRMLGKTVTITNYVISSFAMVYVSNHDQSAMVLIGALVLLLSFSHELKLDSAFVKMVIVYLVIAILLYIAMLMVPGHINRMKDPTEVLFWFPEYFEWSFVKKVYHGYTSTVANMIYGDILLFEVFCLLIFVAALTRGNMFDMLISTIPLGTMLCAKQLGSDRFIRYFDHTIGMPELVPLDGTFASLIPLILTLVTVGAIFVSVIRIVKNDYRKWGLVSLMILAAGSREMMGFSGTIYASSFRTFTAFLYILIISCLILINEITENVKACKE